MPTVRVRDNEPFEVALRRFKRACEKASILSEVRRREFHEKPTQARKRKLAAAVKRHLKKVQRENPLWSDQGGKGGKGGGASSGGSSRKK